MPSNKPTLTESGRKLSSSISGRSITTISLAGLLTFASLLAAAFGAIGALVWTHANGGLHSRFEHDSALPAPCIKGRLGMPLTLASVSRPTPAGASRQPSPYHDSYRTYTATGVAVNVILAGPQNPANVRLTPKKCEARYLYLKSKGSVYLQFCIHLLEEFQLDAHNFIRWWRFCTTTLPRSRRDGECS